MLADSHSNDSSQNGPDLACHHMSPVDGILRSPQSVTVDELILKI